VMAWNVKYGAGRIDFWFDLWGDRVQMSEVEVQANLRGIYDLIEEVDPDILMTEEIEINSRRSADNWLQSANRALASLRSSSVMPAQ